MRPQLWARYLAFGFLATLVYYAAPAGRDFHLALFQVIGVSCVVALAAGIRRGRPDQRRAWRLILAGQAAFVIADGIWLFYEVVLRQETPFPSVPDLFYLAGYPLFAAGLVLLVRARSPRRDRGTLIDASIITIGLGVLSWTFLMVPYARDPSLGLLEKLISIAYPLMDVLLLAVAARLALSPGARTHSYRLLMASLTGLLVADAAYGVVLLNGTYSDGSWIDLGWIVSYVCIGAAALHPNMSDLSTRTVERAPRLTARRLLLLATASLLAPVILGVKGALGGRFEVPVIAAGAAVVFLLVVLRMAGLAREIGEHALELQRNQEALRETEARYRALIEHTPAVTYLATLDGRVEYMSPQAREVLGHTAEEWLTDRSLWRRIVHPDDIEQLDRERRWRADQDGHWTFEYRIVDGSERTVWVQEVAVLLRDDRGRPTGWQGVVIDISELKRARELELALSEERRTSEHLRVLDEMKDMFISAVSHELRTPLSVVLGTALTLQAKDTRTTPEERVDLLDALARSARKLDRLLADLLDVDRLRRGVMEPRCLPTDLAALVERVVEDSGIRADRFVHVDTEPIVASVDPARVERIVDNLLANAMKHTPRGTLVWVSVREDDGGALISVDDAGPGIPEQERAAIFEPFRRGENAPAHSPGVGIGLSLVSSFAELHGGRAWATEHDGGGASFRVWLPLSPSRAGALAPA